MRTELSGQIAEPAGRDQAVRQAQDERDDARSAATLAGARLRDQHGLRQGLDRAAQQAV
ncbi:hypothetical protein [Streptosporangium sp. NPDC048865]|uniref:hypothetical protein n=1 Tax=Streptosporangium sp. NPDC048865 TaxID=3155766 RepID=UPI00341A4A43